MKMTTRANELLIKLIEIEPVPHQRLLRAQGSELRKNLLKLYCLSDSAECRGLIDEIMKEGGYPWFQNLAKSLRGAPKKQHPTRMVSQYGGLYSDRQFLDLSPANGYFH